MTENPTDVALELVDAHDDGGESIVQLKAGQVQLSSGVVVSAKAVPLTLLQDTQRRYWKLEPKPPVVFVKSKGRNEENRDHPDYKEALSRWNQELIMSQLDIMLLKGVNIVSVPDHIELWHDDEDGALPEWLDDLILLGTEISLRENSRRLHWLKYMACIEANDIKLISELIAKKTGISEEDVKEASRRFRS